MMRILAFSGGIYDLHNFSRLLLRHQGKEDTFDTVSDLAQSGRKDEENDAGSVSSDDPSSTGSHSPELLWTGGKRSFVSPLKESRKPVSVRFDESRLAPGHDRLGKGQEAISQVEGRFLVDSARTAFLIASFSL